MMFRSVICCSGGLYGCSGGLLVGLPNGEGICIGRFDSITASTTIIDENVNSNAAGSGSC